MPELLQGKRVVSLAVNLPGPLAAARLAGLGATVTKIESPAGDPLSAVAPGWYAELTVGQRVVVLDLKDPAGRTALDNELLGADLLLTAMRPSALRRLGLGSAHLTYPGLSHVEIVGHDGDREDTPGHDLTYQAAQGTLQPPTMPTVPVADLLGGERALSSALLALLARTQTPSGRRYRVVLEDIAAEAGAAVRHGLMGEGAPLGGAIPSYGIYASADGHVAVGALEPHFRDRLVDTLGVGHDRDELARVFANGKTAHWEELAERVDIPIVGIRTPTRGATK